MESMNQVSRCGNKIRACKRFWWYMLGVSIIELVVAADIWEIFSIFFIWGWWGLLEKYGRHNSKEGQRAGYVTSVVFLISYGCLFKSFDCAIDCYYSVWVVGVDLVLSIWYAWALELLNTCYIQLFSSYCHMLTRQYWFYWWCKYTGQNNEFKYAG